MTLPEVLLWEKLRRGRLNGLRFRRQHPIGPFIVDFYSSSARLALEIDGAGHEHSKQRGHDKRRDNWLTENGITVVRILATDVLNDETMEGVLIIIEQAADPSTASRSPSPAAQGRNRPEISRQQSSWEDNNQCASTMIVMPI